MAAGKHAKQFALRTLLGALTLSGIVVAQVVPGPPGPPSGPQGPQRNFQAQAQGFGLALSGLTAEQLAAFQEGRTEFLNVETPEGGLGPIFNGRSCVECHGVPAPGGASNISVVRFGHSENGLFDALDAKGGSLLQRFAIDPALRERIPREANVVADRQSTPLFGLGLIEAIPDEAILANAARAKPDGIAGRAAIIDDVVSGKRLVGKFGWKAQQASVLAFSADAYRNEMGITNRFFPTENAPNGNTALLAPYLRNTGPDDVVDASGRGDIDLVADFMRFLGAPPRAAANASARAGETLFANVGCASCHQPLMTTGRNAVAALSEKPVALYSDLLLHDMGALNDGIAQADAGTNEMKTPPLWGLRVTAPYLHDGRAATIDQAIRLHDGEAKRVRDRYAAMPAAQRQQLLDFLNTL
jgi:CxxC motif-containing protein (DUF1111 family)